MRTINIFIEKNDCPDVNLSSYLQKARNFFAEKGISVFFDSRDMNAGYHIYMSIRQDKFASGDSSATLADINKRKPNGYYKIGFCYGALQSEDGKVVYGQSYEGIIIHEILHCCWGEAGMEDIHDKNLGQKDNDLVFAMFLEREKNHPNKSIVHHSAVNSVGWQYDAVRKYHIKNKGWGDIGYHFFIEPDGALKIGRWWFREGAHTLGQNFSSLGVCVARNCDSMYPTTPQKNVLRAILKTINKPIFGHRDFSSTACPGRYLFKKW